MGKRSKTIFYELVQACGYCCPFEFFSLNSKVRTGLLAQILGLEPRTVRYWRAAFKAQNLRPCRHCQVGQGKISQLAHAGDDIFSRLPNLARKLLVSRGKT